MKNKPGQYTYDEWVKRHPEVLEDDEKYSREIYQKLCQEDLTMWKNWKKALGKK